MHTTRQVEKINYVRYRSEQLAEHLRESLARGELTEPLPTLREWSSHLGVSTGTLQAALKILKREGLIRSRPRQGFSIAQRPPPRRTVAAAPVVRWILVRQAHDNVVVTEVLGRLAQKLAAHRIGLSMEVCDEARLETICREGEREGELLLVSTDRRENEKLLAGLGNVLLFSPLTEGTRLPYIDLDVGAALRHAVFAMCRRGFDRISLVNARAPSSDAARRREFMLEFQQIFAQAPRRVRGEVLWLPEDSAGQQQEVQRLAARVRGRQGFVTNAPVVPGALMMALMQRGWKIPGEVEVMAVNCAPGQAITVPPVIHYPYPVEPFCKAVLQAALHYVDQGVLPRMRKLIPLTMVSQL